MGVFCKYFKGPPFVLWIMSPIRPWKSLDYLFPYTGIFGIYVFLLQQQLLSSSVLIAVLVGRKELLLCITWTSCTCPSAGLGLGFHLSSVSCPLQGWGFPRLGTQMACLSYGARWARQLGVCFWADNSLFFQRVWKWTPGELCKWRPFDISSEGKKIPWSSFTLNFSSSSVTSICIERTSVQEKLHMQYKIVVFLLLVGWSTYPHSLLLPLILKDNQRN